MGLARDAIHQGVFPQFLQTFFARYFEGGPFPRWCVDALRSVGVDLLEGKPETLLEEGSGAKWERAISN